MSTAPPTWLTDQPWRVLQIDTAGGMVSVLPDTELTATFGADGFVGGSTGCNTYRGPFSISDSAINFGALITTRRACLSDTASAQEQAFLAALSASTSYQVVGDRLTLLDSAGAAHALLVRPSAAEVNDDAAANPALLAQM